jgi:hypothetical protein
MSLADFDTVGKVQTAAAGSKTSGGVVWRLGDSPTAKPHLSPLRAAEGCEESAEKDFPNGTDFATAYARDVCCCKISIFNLGVVPLYLQRQSSPAVAVG